MDREESNNNSISARRKSSGIEAFWQSFKKALNPQYKESLEFQNNFETKVKVDRENESSFRDVIFPLFYLLSFLSTFYSIFSFLRIIIEFNYDSDSNLYDEKNLFSFYCDILYSLRLRMIFLIFLTWNKKHRLFVPILDNFWLNYYFLCLIDNFIMISLGIMIAPVILEISFTLMIKILIFLLFFAVLVLLCYVVSWNQFNFNQVKRIPLITIILSIFWEIGEKFDLIKVE